LIESSVSSAPSPGAEANAAPIATPRARVIAFYLPQFHPIPENDRAWGKGFTEWTNVAKAKPRFLGHQQPQLPADLGFYDLRVPETRQAQADLARAHGIEAFCYWHYWFGNGRRILERPFNEVLASGEPDFPFCLCWAIGSWTGVWFGNPGDIIVEQTFPGRDDELAHFEAVLPALRDSRNLRVDGKPMFCVFYPHQHPDLAGFVAHWRSLAAEAGLPGLYLVAVSDGLDDPGLDVFDAITTSPPNDYLFPRSRGLFTDLRRLLRERNFGALINRLIGDGVRLPERRDYRHMVATVLDRLPPGPRFHPCVMPNWDNTPRSGPRGLVFEHAEPEVFDLYLAKALDRVNDRPPEHRLIFLKAWNEWAEGNYVEPDQRRGMAWLEVIRRRILA